MASGINIRTYWQGRWHDGNLPVMRAADHGSWLGTTVFDGARHFDGMTPDLDLHCQRFNRSAVAMSLTPICSSEDIAAIIREGLKAYGPKQSVYVRPMYWGIDDDAGGLGASLDSTGFAICLEEVPMPPADASATLTRTRFRRPVLEDSVCNAKAGCLYPNNARMIAEARAKGFTNALVADALGNVAESAMSNVFLVKDGVAFTPIANGTFLAGITRSRHIANLRADGVEVVEKVLTFDDAHGADEMFLAGNFTKVTPVTRFDETEFKSNDMARKARQLYWDWAASQN